MSEKMFSLEKFANGALSEKMDLEFKKVLANIADPNTDFKKPRKIVATIEFKASEERDFAGVNIKVESKLVPSKPVAVKIIIDSNANGEAVAAEIGNGIIPGQVSMDTKEIEKEELNKKSADVIDLKKVKNR